MKNIIEKIKENNIRIIAIDGRCASGKTTIGNELAKFLNAEVIHMDDFFLTPEMRTKERLNEVGGNVDRERFEKEVLIPLSKNEIINYLFKIKQIFNFNT